MRACILATATLLAVPHCFAAEPRCNEGLLEPTPNVTPREQRDFRAIKAAFESRLKRKVSFDFVDMPLEDAINFINVLLKVGVIIDPGVSRDGDSKKTVTLKVENEEIGVAIQKVLAQIDPDLIYVIQPPLLITTKKLLNSYIYLEIYDATDLLATSPALCDEITKSVEPQSWTAKTYLKAENGYLIVQQTKGVHDKLRKFLDEKRALNKK